MSTNFDKALIMSGNDFKLTNSITLHHPIIDEILSLNNGFHSEEIYWQYVHSIMCDPYANMIMLDDLGKDFLKTSPFEVFLLQWENYQRDYQTNKQQYDLLGINPLQFIQAALNFFIVEEHNFELSKHEDGSPCLYDTNNAECQIDEDIFVYLYEWLKSINKIDYSNRIKPADENARRILIEDARDELKKQKRRNKKSEDSFEYIGNLMSAICFGGNGSITPFNIKSCSIYWLFEAYSVDNKKSHASHILDGLYHGTVSSKDIKTQELDWVN
ncbi:hypothetical protein [Anaerosporobacter sp.]|uniref:hypothetical protein n=1 Tax=Anaerosporobacter sp. TaxID=1872529 RepID=UPI00286F7800|nr:hypothetical protein [Anaerosporobacter sp.]